LSYDTNMGYLLTDDKELELAECKFELEKEIEKTIEKSIKLLEKMFSTKLLSCGKVSFLGGSLEADRVLLSIEEREGGADYVPVVIELKRMDNRELRREVLAQLLEYMTAIYLEPHRVIRACQDKGMDFDMESLEKLKKNIEERRIRGIILSDKIPEILKKTINLLNEELDNPEIYGVELKRLCSSDGKYSVLIPVLIGATTEAERKKTTKILWTYDELYQVYKDIKDELLRRRLLDLLEWAREKGLLVEHSSSEPQFKITPIITVNPTGKLYVRFGKSNESKLPKPRRQKLLEELQKLKMLPSDIEDADSVADGRQTSRGIHELSEEEFKRLKELFEELFLQT